MTILEVLVGMSLFLIVAFGVYLVYETSQGTYWRASAKADLQEGVRAAMERMRQEFWMAGYDPSGTGQPAVQSPTSASLAVITDADGNDVSDLVRYDRDAAARTLRRTVQAWTGTGWGPAAVTTLATNVDALTFQYYPSAALPGLQRLRITIQTSEAVTAHPTQQYQVSTDVLLRNL